MCDAKNGQKIKSMQNPQFLSNHYETQSKLGTQEYGFLTEFCNDWVKIADFLLKAYFSMCTLAVKRSRRTHKIGPQMSRTRKVKETQK